MNAQPLTPFLACLAISAGCCLWPGCVSQDSAQRQHAATEAPTGKPSTKSKSAAQVPEVVQRAFQVRFPTAGRAEWKLKSDANYEAEFTLEQTEIAAKFDPTGKWLETESAIPRSHVPHAIQDTIARRFQGYKVVESQTIERYNEPRPIYELHLDNRKVIVKAQLSADGAILSQSEKPKP